MLSFSIAKEKRGRGLASRYRGWGSGALVEFRSARVHAFVKPENIPSARAFENAGFDRAGESQVRGSVAIEFVRARK